MSRCKNKTFSCFYLTLYVCQRGEIHNLEIHNLNEMHILVIYHCTLKLFKIVCYSVVSSERLRHKDEMKCVMISSLFQHFLSSAQGCGGHHLPLSGHMSCRAILIAPATVEQNANEPVSGSRNQNEFLPNKSGSLV